MTRLAWSVPGERYFEAGVDRGVLYLDGADGVPWNGLTSVSESTTGGEVSQYYIDGINYLNDISGEEFKATIQAYTYPEEFGVCDGTVEVSNGLFMTNQKKKSFGLSYRNQIGNDVDGVEHGYKFHIVYNALAAPSQHDHKTLGDSVEADDFSWEITTKPPDFTGYKPTAHLVIDTRKAPKPLVLQIEDILYGTDTEAPRLPSVPELIFLFDAYALSSFDAGTPTEAYFITFDGGTPPDILQTSTIDGGAP
jgi:hypothetical protein